jgi:uncharacterized protein YrzB (UPF0473 family)
VAEESEVVTLQDEDGLEHRFNVVDIVEVERRRYAVLLPEDDDEGAAVIFRMESDDRLVPIDDDDELTRVMTALEETSEYGEVVLEGDDDEGRDMESLEDLAEAEGDEEEYDEDEDEDE